MAVSVFLNNIIINCTFINGTKLNLSEDTIIKILCTYLMELTNY